MPVTPRLGAGTVHVYFDRTRKCWSVRCPKTRRVLNGLSDGKKVRLSRVVLWDVEFVVGRRARERVLATKRRTVHAYAKGEVGTLLLSAADAFTVRVTYNPFSAPDFVRTDTGAPVRRVPVAVFRDGAVWCRPQDLP